MSRVSLLLAPLVLALAAVAGGNPAQAQTSGYPYWATAPSSYAGSIPWSPGPMITPSTISDAARSPSGYSSDQSYPGGVGAGVGGREIPSFLKIEDARSRMAGSNQTGPDNKAHIWLRVPADATVWVDGVKTKQTGEARHFFSPPLRPGKNYTYRLLVRWTKDGKKVEKSRDVAVHAGADVRLDFTRPQTDEEGK